jgi:hypothetical protein
MISWSASFLTSRSTTLSFDGRTDQQLPITTGIPQGSPASPILFLLYLHPLFDTLCDSHLGLWCPSYIDDLALVVHGRSREDNMRSLEAAAATAFRWAEESAVAFDDAKSELLHFHWERQDVVSEATKVRLPNGTVVGPGMRGGRQDVVRCISMYLDRKHTFSQHVHTSVAAAQGAFLALCRLARYETGFSPAATHQLHQACITSRSDFGAEIWWNRQKNLEQMLQQQQNRALRWILNTFTSTPIITLHNEAAMQLVSVYLDQKHRNYALRLLSLPPNHPVAQRCPESFPIPNLIDVIPDVSDEYDYDW